MRRSTRQWKALGLMGSFLALTSCGSNGKSGGPRAETGTITEEWATFCTATFTADTPIVDASEEPIFTAHAGDEFLLADFSDDVDARLVYLTNDGPDSFEVEARDGAWPFTSNCTVGQGVSYYAVFTDVSVFAEKELTTKVCDLSKGAALPAGSGARGFTFSGSQGSSDIYEVLLGPFSAKCGGRAKGYVSVPQTQSLGTITWLVPFASIIGPD
jgi:hypothetical protein